MDSKKMTAEERRVLDSFLFVDDIEAKRLKAHPIRTSWPIRDGWLLLGDIPVLLGRLKNLQKRAVFGEKHGNLTRVKLPRVLKHLRERSLIETQDASFRKKGEDRSLQVHRITPKIDVWRELALLAVERGKFAAFLKTEYHSHHPAAGAFLRRYQLVTLGDFPEELMLGLIEQAEELLEGKGGGTEAWALASPTLLKQYLQQPEKVRDKIAKLQRKLQGSLLNNPQIIFNTLLLGESYAQGNYSELHVPLRGLEQIIRIVAEVKRRHDAMSDEERDRTRKELRQMKEAMEVIGKKKAATRV